MTRANSNSAEAATQSRPDIYGYYDYRFFLKEWFAYLKEEEKGFSIRALAAEAGVSAGYLPLVMAGERNLSAKTLAKLLPHLRLNPSEQSYFENLVKLSAPDTIEAQIKALSRMKRSRTYKSRHPNEVEFFEYMGSWYHIVIREMAGMSDFKMDASWIRSKLKVKLPLSTIASALEFLVDNGYLVADASGKVEAPKELLKCVDTVYSKTLRFYHKQMLALAAESMNNTPTSERYLFGYTFALDSKNYEAARKVMENAIQELEKLEKSQQGPRDSVYHLELALFPVAKRSAE